MDFTYFQISESTSLDELRAQYSDLAKSLHPDSGGNESEFCAMREEYERAIRAITWRNEIRKLRRVAIDLALNAAKVYVQNPEKMNALRKEWKSGQLKHRAAEWLSKTVSRVGNDFLIELLKTKL